MVAQPLFASFSKAGVAGGIGLLQGWIVEGGFFCESSGTLESLCSTECHEILLKQLFLYKIRTGANFS